MQREEFQRFLRYGLGRIILYLQDHDAAPYQDLIMAEECQYDSNIGIREMVSKYFASK